MKQYTDDQIKFYHEKVLKEAIESQGEIKKLTIAEFLDGIREFKKMNSLGYDIEIHDIELLGENSDFNQLSEEFLLVLVLLALDTNKNFTLVLKSRIGYKLYVTFGRYKDKIYSCHYVMLEKDNM